MTSSRAWPYAIQDGIRDQLGDALFEPQNGDWRGDYRRTLTDLVAPEQRERTIANRGRRAGRLRRVDHAPRGRVDPRVR